jgi:hypothetical protein
MDLIGIDLHTDSFYVVKTHSAASGVIRLEKKYALHGESWDVFSQSLHKEDYVNRPGFRGDLILWEDRSWVAEVDFLRK